MEQAVIEQLIARIYQLLGERLRVRGDTLTARVKRAGRLLPKHVRRAARELIDAETMAQNPTLAMKLDPSAVSKAYETCQRHLMGIDPREARIRKLYNVAALVAAQVLIIAAGAIVFMRWRGLI